MTKKVYRSLDSIVHKEAKEYAIYSAEERAIPNMIDGLKPVHRFVMYQALQTARDKVEKIASLGGSVSKVGYHHGEASAEKAAVGVANTWANIVPILQGQGNFGSRLVREAAEARYVYAKVHKNWYRIYKDTEYAPEHPDKEHIPPKHYLPIIPMVLVNGIYGIATGYATNIPAHSLDSIVKCTRLAIEGKLDIEPEYALPEFFGKISKIDDGWYAEGAYERKGKTQITITEIPPKYDREEYIAKVLNPLEDKDFITYRDACGKPKAKEGPRSVFRFVITVRKEFGLSGDYDADHEKIMTAFKLREKINPNLTVINEHGRMEKFETASELIRRFVAYRMTFVEKRIARKVEETLEAMNLAKAKAVFIAMVLKEQIILTRKTRAQALDEIRKHESLAPWAEQLIAMNLYHMTNDEVQKLVEAAKKFKADHDYWLQTTPQVEYFKDLDSL